MFQDSAVDLPMWAVAKHRCRCGFMSQDAQLTDPINSKTKIRAPEPMSATVSGGRLNMSVVSIVMSRNNILSPDFPVERTKLHREIVVGADEELTLSMLCKRWPG